MDLAAVLGFTGMLNQVQFHASLRNEKLEGGGFSGVAKAEVLKRVPDEPPNETNVEVSCCCFTMFVFADGIWSSL